MPYAFDGQSFSRLLSDNERLVVGAIEHERRLTSLVALLEGHGDSLSSSDSVEFAVVGQPASGAPSSMPLAGADLLSLVRELCIDARAQRLLAETTLARLVGGLAREDEAVRVRPRALVIDDTEDSRDVAALILETAGVNAITASNGLEAVIVAHYAQPCAVFTDISMPVLGGLDTVRLLKSSSVTRHLPVIAVTARPEICEEPPFSALFTAVLAKPIAPERLIAEMQRFL